LMPAEPEVAAEECPPAPEQPTTSSETAASHGLRLITASALPRRRPRGFRGIYTTTTVTALMLHF
jgi:hypothetical protein